MFATLSRVIAQSLTVLAFGIFAWPTSGVAQGQFGLFARVNDAAITQFEFDQRLLLLDFLRTPGDLEKEAMQRLIDERLQLDAAIRAGFSLSDEDISGGITEFAARADQTGEQFVASIGEAGVATETFYDFIKSGLAWRNLVRSRFGGRINVTEADIDAAVSLAETRGSARVLISEIFLPTNTPENEARAKILASQISELKTISAFADAARRFSGGPSRGRGGRVDSWVEISALPPQIRALLLTMKPGEVTSPVKIPNALALIQLRAIEATAAPARKDLTIDYAAYYINGRASKAAMARAAKVLAAVDTCDDLYGIAQNEPLDVLDRKVLKVAEIPPDVALELASLDPGEVSTALTRANGQTLVFLMLCGRSGADAAEISRDDVRRNLRNQRLSALADAYLDELRADAIIIFP
ncbi:MAG: peptidylprolyl isomerase [Paracoccaceae bacterium]